jgi:hypothetical protein
MRSIDDGVRQGSGQPRPTDLHQSEARHFRSVVANASSAWVYVFGVTQNAACLWRRGMCITALPELAMPRVR